MPKEKQAFEFLKDIGISELIRDKPQTSFLTTESEIENLAKAHNAINANKVAEPIKANIGQTQKTSFSLDNNIKSINESRRIADEAKNLEELKSAVLAFSGCDLKNTCIQTVFSDGNPDGCEAMIIGEAPGANEDEQGIPFCGMSGKLMDSYMEVINLKRATNLYISNSVFWRPPGNRKPTELEIKICRPFVEKHIALIKPKLLIAVGSSSLESLLPNIGKTITQVRGKLLDYHNDYLDEPIKIFPTFHPSYLLRQPLKKKDVWDDLIKIRKFLA